MLQKKTEYVFRKNPKQQIRNWTTNFAQRRKVIARKLNNLRIQKIKFKTLRHYKGTVLYHKTKDILHVKETLGHKDINNTLVYVHLESAIFKTGNDSFTVKTAKTVTEAQNLLEVGFEYVTDIDNVKIFRKLK